MSKRLYNEIARYLGSTKAEFLGPAKRFIYERRPLKGRKGLTKRKYFQVVAPNDQRYKTAPYEETIVLSGQDRVSRE